MKFDNFIHEFSLKNNLTIEKITFKFHGKKLKRKGYELRNRYNCTVLYIEPVYYTNFKFLISGQNKDGFFVTHLKRIDRKLFYNLNLEFNYLQQ